MASSQSSRMCTSCRARRGRTRVLVATLALYFAVHFWGTSPTALAWRHLRVSPRGNQTKLYLTYDSYKNWDPREIPTAVYTWIRRPSKRGTTPRSQNCSAPATRPSQCASRCGPYDGSCYYSDEKPSCRSQHIALFTACCSPCRQSTRPVQRMLLPLRTRQPSKRPVLAAALSMTLFSLG